MISLKIIVVNTEKDISQKLMQQIDLGLDDITDLIFARSQELCRVDEATLKKSGHVEREFFHKTIEYDAPHAPYMEYGTRPHMPPSAPIIAWAKRKFGLSDKEAYKAGWAIAMKIKERGGLAHPYLRPAVDETAAKAKEIILNRMKT